jgi:ABC-2 type transport system ATP-binding protein
MIRIKNLTQKFGRHCSLDDVSFEVSKGDLFGIVGPNGAGKTTLLRILATLLKPTRGEVKLAGIDVIKQPDRARWKFGYMPDDFGLYPDLTVEEYLQFFGDVYKIGRAECTAMVEDLMALVDLQSKVSEPVQRLSRGMQQRLSLARCLLHDPEVLLLDEPASGLDPHARRQIRSLLKELRNMGKTILLSSHHLADVHELCNRVMVMEESKMLFCGDVDELFEKYGSSHQYSVRVDGPPEKALEFLLSRPGIRGAEIVGNRIEFGVEHNGSDNGLLLADLQSGGLAIQEFQMIEPSFEDIFMNITSGTVN